jgi:hypothetical protein
VTLPGQPTFNAAAPSVHTFDDVEFTDAVQTITATVHYADGLIKTNGDGVPVPGSVMAGLLTRTAALQGYRKAFWGVSSVKGSAPTTSAQVRGLAGSTSNAAQRTMVIDIPAGTFDIMFAYPASLGDDIDVRAQSFSGVDYSSAFTKSTVNVEGAGGFTAVPYHVYYFSADVGFPVSDQYTVTIS